MEKTTCHNETIITIRLRSLENIFFRAAGTSQKNIKLRMFLY